MYRMLPAAFDLNWRHLRAVTALAGTKRLTAAAEAVSLSQPALTQGLAKLERQLGITLFDRRSNGMRPLPAGAVLADRVGRAFAHLAEGARAAARGGRGFVRAEQLMTASQLRALLSLADAGSFVAAADAAGLSQPALHRAVRDLEQLCALPLAERRGRGVALTAAGRRLARGIRLAEREVTAGIAEACRREDSGRLVVGAMPLCRALLLPRAIAALVGEQPAARIDVVEGSWRELVTPLADGTLDLTVGALRDPAPVGLEQRALFTDRLAVIGRAGHPLTGVAAPTLDAIAHHGWIVGHPETPLRAHWEALFAGRARPPAPIECGSVMVSRGVLLQSDLLTLLSPDQVAMELSAGLLAQIGPPLDQATRTIGVTLRAGWRPTRLQARFLELLDEAASATRVQQNE